MTINKILIISHLHICIQSDISFRIYGINCLLLQNNSRKNSLVLFHFRYILPLIYLVHTPISKLLMLLPHLWEISLINGLLVAFLAQTRAWHQKALPTVVSFVLKRQYRTMPWKKVRYIYKEYVIDKAKYKFFYSTIA